MGDAIVADKRIQLFGSKEYHFLSWLKSQERETSRGAAVNFSQEEIAGIAVGQTAEVQMERFGTIEGTVSEKSVEPESGTSRTNVVYTVDISIENETGRISSGTAVTVILDAEDADEEEQG